MKFGKLLKYEIINILRNRWVFIYTVAVAATTFVLQKISADYQKTLISLSSLSVIFVPLVSSFFTTLYWYYNDRFTQLMLTQPVTRRSLLAARFTALSMSLSLCYALGAIAGSLLLRQISMGMILLVFICWILTFVFVALSLLISIKIDDRMKGVGLVFGIWLYFVLIHDSIILLCLIALREYPMDLPGGFLGIISPIGLGRVVLLMYNEGSLLLGHTGAVVRELLTSWRGYALAAVVAVIWSVVPFAFSIHQFKKKDF